MHYSFFFSFSNGNLFYKNTMPFYLMFRRFIFLAFLISSIRGDAYLRSSAKLDEDLEHLTKEDAFIQILLLIQKVVLTPYPKNEQLLKDLLFIQDLVIRSEKLNESEFLIILKLLDKLVKLKKHKNKKSISYKYI